MALESIVTIPVHELPFVATPAPDTVYVCPAPQLKVLALTAFAVLGRPKTRVNDAVNTAKTFSKNEDGRCEQECNVRMESSLIGL